MKNKKKSAILLFAVSCCFAHLPAARAQSPEMPVAEQQLENITENNSDNETEDDSYAQQLQQFAKHPVNLNTAAEEELQELKLLSPLQIQNLINYRKLFGSFINLYELQAVPGWDIDIIQKIRPFITVDMNEKLTAALKKRFHNGEHSLLARIAQTPERSKGYLQDSVINYYPGTPQKLLVRYKYLYKNLLQYGVVAEKDAGEQFFKGQQKQGFDFYSAHFFLRNAGAVRSLAIGDFAVNLGQGLTQWQSLAFKKSAGVLNVKREADVLRPYNSAGEIYFHRGAGITLKRKNVQATCFVSVKNVDANFVSDSLSANSGYITSFQTSGYHRTRSETEDKGKQRQWVVGGNIAYRHKSLHIGLNAVQYKFKWPVLKDPAPYNLYALSGRAAGNYSADYSFTFKNLHLFGEAAVNNNRHAAFVNGMLISVSAAVDMSCLYRDISPGYQSLYTNAFTENATPVNEKGIYMGISIHPGGALRVDGYADFYKFPWLRSQVDAPSSGSDLLLQLTYKPNRQLEIYSRFRAESKARNSNPGDQVFSSVMAQPRKNWRTQINIKLNSSLNVRSRTELVLSGTGRQREQGFLGYTEAIYKPLLKSWSVNARAQFFESESYDSRLYAYETDVLYSYSIPVFYDKGFRYYAGGSLHINKKLTVWFRWAQTIYTNKKITGSGLDAINGPQKTDVKLQLQYLF